MRIRSALFKKKSVKQADSRIDIINKIDHLHYDGFEFRNGSDESPENDPV